MKKKFSSQQLLVLFTSLLALLLLFGMVIQKSFFPSTFQLNQLNNPLIGSASAPIKMFLIEDLNCGYCRRFTKEIFPQIEKLYLATGKASCLFVPVSFLHDSKPLANACLAVYHHSPDRFGAYLHALFEHFAEEADLLPLAEQVGGINLEKLAECMETGCYYAQIKKNYLWAKELMGPGFGTPALYINGIRTPTASFALISEQIEKQL